MIKYIMYNRPILRLKTNITQVKPSVNNNAELAGNNTAQPVIIQTNNHTNITSKEKNTQIQLKARPKILLSKDEYTNILNLLQTTYPKCFTTPPTPLAIGIHKELLLLEQEYLPKTKIRKFLRIYCRNINYRKAIILGSNRVNLNGTVVGTITENKPLKQN
ncbi:ProQ/FINO family protein [Candidatus Tisiphia endosymbiont of Nedyus quadrimaculatus]|uniref:ProQ/FINO family protein n=1 Tax=Candidatus Tisiphia endosymbiont of Nedyus quadrimaculatus TaxID=3139332 RepID=UPI00345EE9C1